MNSNFRLNKEMLTNTFFFFARILDADVEQIFDVTTMATTDENVVGGYTSSHLAPDVKRRSAANAAAVKPAGHIFSGVRYLR